MVIMFLSFAESCDPLNSFNLGVGRGYNFTLYVCQTDFWQVTYYMLWKISGDLWVQYCNFGCMSPWHIFSWLGGSISHFHHLVMSWEIPGLKLHENCQDLHTDCITLNTCLYLTYQSQGSWHAFCFAFFFSLHREKDSLNHAGYL